MRRGLDLAHPLDGGGSTPVTFNAPKEQVIYSLD